MKEHNFEIGDKVSGVRNGSAVWYGTVTVLCGHGIECWEQDFRVYIYIPNHMLYTLTNITKQQESKEQQMKEQNIKQSNIKPEDEVTITTTYRGLARVYAIIGHSNGRGNADLFGKLQHMLDPEGQHYMGVSSSKRGEDVLDYHSYQLEFEALLFPQEPIETEQQKQIRELREQAEALLQKAKDIESSQK